MILEVKHYKKDYENSMLPGIATKFLRETVFASFSNCLNVELL
jgi:hypothetical protein